MYLSQLWSLSHKHARLCFIRQWQRSQTQSLSGRQSSSSTLSETTTDNLRNDGRMHLDRLVWRRQPCWRNSPAARRRKKQLALSDPAGSSTDEVPSLWEGLVKRAISMEMLERDSAADKEVALRFTLDREELERRGLALHGLKVDPKYWRFCDGGKVDIRLIRSDDLSDVSFSRGFRVGSLVDLVLPREGEEESDNVKLHAEYVEGWRRVFGIISSTTDSHICVRVGSLSNFLSQCLGAGLRRHSANGGGGGARTVHLVRRSDLNIYRNKLKSLAGMQKEKNDSARKGKSGVKLGPAAEEIVRRVFNKSSTNYEQQQEGGALANVQSKIFNPCLDESQIKAVENCDQGKLISIIHGPPGTGKTTVLAAAVLSALARDPKTRVLVTAPSHAACDAAMLAILKYWPVDLLGEPHKGCLLRLAQELRLTVSSLKPFLASVFNQSKLSKLERDLRTVREGLLEGSPKGRGDLLKLESDLVERMTQEVSDATDAAASRARVVVCTNMQAMTACVRRQLRAGLIDLVCVDEAGFTNDGNVLHLLPGAKKIIISGDHLQLPPVVQNDEARKRGYDVSLLERLSDAPCPDGELSLLTTQYRSNAAISLWSSDYFYDGQVVAHGSVAGALIQDLPGVQAGCPETTSPLMLVDTSDADCAEESDGFNDGNGDDESIANYGEAFVVEAVVKRIVSLGVDPSAVGVVSPYWAQVSVLRSLLWLDARSRRTEVRTVDGYQGREKEVVVVSLVRSNEERTVGFLEETRRVNVAVTRAKKACVLVGDTRTLNSDPGMRSLIKYCRAHGKVLPASTFLSQ